MTFARKAHMLYAPVTWKSGTGASHTNQDAARLVDVLKLEEHTFCRIRSASVATALHAILRSTSFPEQRDQGGGRAVACHLQEAAA